MKKPSLRWLLLLVAVSSCSTDTGPKTGNPGLPAKLSFSQQPTNAVKDTAFVSPIKVQLLDQNGDLTTATDNVTLALGVNPKSAHVTGTLTVAAVSGVATFPGLKLDSVGTGYRLVATSGALPADTSAAFAVTLSLKDFDADGYSPNQGDCNDADAAVHPGAVDFPDPSLVDANCDGLDGDRAVAVFVRFTGDDSLGCGTEGQPCKTIQTGISRAVTGGKRDVYVGAGAYPSFVMADGVNVFGGFDDTFGRLAASAVTVTGRLQAVAGMPDSVEVAVVASGLTQLTILADMRLTAGGAVGTDAAGNGRNSYVVLVRNTTGPGLIVARSHLALGAGTKGADGADGTDADSLAADSAMMGGTGGDGLQISVSCDDTSYGKGGLAGANGAAGGTSGGAAGGHGGTMDNVCACCSFDFIARAGTTGDSAQQVAIGLGHGGAGGSGGSACGLSTDGEPGVVTNGTAGNGGSGNGALVSGAWIGASGDSGGLGANGGGGGGGGGAGGCDNGTDSYGPGGGGGGAGGVAAVAGGRGGKAGGGAFGVYVVDATVTVSADSIVGGQGGAGGSGGVGGQGQSGGAGGPSGVKAGNGNPGGAGGAGGHGGHAGGGGGGAGGVVYGIYVATASSVLTNTGNTFVPGTGGAGGAGGVSAPNAPVLERDGNNGASGTTGAVGSTGSCSAPGGC